MSTRQVEIASGTATIRGDLETPANASGVVLFAHGSGSGRFSPRNRAVAQFLNTLSFATLLVDLLTEVEEEEERFTAHHRFDIGLLAARLGSASTFLAGEAVDLPLGYFGASTGTAAALVAAASRPNEVKSVVSRGGRPDLAGDNLPLVKAPTLLIVGSLDHVVVDLNKQALSQLRCEKGMIMVEGATHLFEEPGKIEEVARLAGAWFGKHLCA